jgi:hypothetical protein
MHVRVFTLRFDPVTERFDDSAVVGLHTGLTHEMGLEELQHIVVIPGGLFAFAS